MPLAPDPILLAALALLYGRGLLALWPRTAGRGLPLAQVAAFAGGWLVVAASLLSPLHGLAHDLFAAHMVQHMLLMTLAAPLLALARPWPVLLFGLPRALRRSAGRLVPSRLLASPNGAFVLHGLVMWLWHVPPLYDAALAYPVLHWLEHATMLGAACIFWHLLLVRLPRRRHGYGQAAFILLATLMHAGLLGALLTFAPTPLYASHLLSAPARGLDPLADQQLAGLVMWIPACAAYIVGGLACVGLWLRQLEAPRRPRLESEP